MPTESLLRTSRCACFCSAIFFLTTGLFSGKPLVAQDHPEDAQGKSHKSIGFVASDEASPKQVGLPVYPGARRHKDNDKDDDSTSANLGLWGGSFGFRLAVMKMESNDTPDKVAAFYRKALSTYGTVLDCTNAPRETQKNDSSKQLTCGDDKSENGGMLFKSGTKKDQHLVGIEPHGTGTVFQLVYLEAHGSDSK